MEPNTPAARLHRILTLCKKHEKESTGLPMLAGWRRVFRMVETVPDFTVMERVGRVWSLCVETVEMVERHPELAPQLYLGWREELEEAFLQVHPFAPFKNFADRIPKSLMVNLEFCANALTERQPERIVADETLAEFAKEIQDLWKAVLGAELKPAERAYLLNCISLIKRAMEDYALRGNLGLQQALDGATGALYSQRNVAIPMRDTELGKRFWQLVNRLTTALTNRGADVSAASAAVASSPPRRPRIHVPVNTRNGQPLPKTAKLLQL